MKKKSSLDQIDAYFVGKSEKDINNYAIIALALAAVLVYFLLSAGSQEYFDAKEGGLNDITQKLENSKRELANLSDPTGQDHNYKVNQFKQTYQMVTAQLGVVRDSNNYLDKKLREISNLTYNQENWAKFLDSLTTLAENNTIKLKLVQSDLSQNISAFTVAPVLNVKLNLEGAFSNMLRYINLVEQSEMIVDVNGLDLNNTHADKIGGGMNIAVWGMKYQ